ncbi:MAG TPA: preprotein translocase subunit SecE [bacterium]|nr:preprotein translocase subunit SecE [bacterium]
MAQEKEKINYLLSAKSFFNEVIEESKKIAWPSRETLVQSTLVVLAVIVILSLFMAVADVIWNKGFQLIS